MFDKVARSHGWYDRGIVKQKTKQKIFTINNLDRRNSLTDSTTNCVAYTDKLINAKTKQKANKNLSCCMPEQAKQNVNSSFIDNKNIVGKYKNMPGQAKVFNIKHNTSDKIVQTELNKCNVATQTSNKRVKFAVNKAVQTSKVYADLLKKILPVPVTLYKKL